MGTGRLYFKPRFINLCYQLIVEGKSFLFSSKSLKLYLNSLGTTIKTGKKIIFLKIKANF